MLEYVKLLSSPILMYPFHFSSLFGDRDPGPGPKAAARGPARAWPAVAFGPRPGSRAQECRKNEKDTVKYVKIIF